MVAEIVPIFITFSTLPQPNLFHNTKPCFLWSSTTSSALYTSCFHHSLPAKNKLQMIFQSDTPPWARPLLEPDLSLSQTSPWARPLLERDLSLSETSPWERPLLEPDLSLRETGVGWFYHRKLHSELWNNPQIFITPSKVMCNKDGPDSFKDERANNFHNHLKSSHPQTFHHKALKRHWN